MRERNPVTHEEKLAYLRELREAAVHSASEEAVEKQHAKGKMTARERVEKLLDPGSFEELDTFVRHRTYDFEMQKRRPWGDAVVTGHGTIDGRTVFVFSQDFTVFGGSLGEVMAEKMCKVMDLAAQVGAPVIGINDSGGARIQEGVVSLGAYGDVFVRNVQCSGVIPQISLIMGPCAGGAVYSPAMTDFIFMVKETSHMFITGPEVIKTVTGEEVEFEELGGAMSHNTKSGVAHFAAEDEESCLEDARYLLGFLPSNNLEAPPRFAPEDDPEREDEDARHARPRRPLQALRHARGDLPHRRRRASSSRSTSTSPRTSSAASRGSTASRSASSATSPPSWPACSTSRPPRRRPASSAPATPTTSRSLTFTDVPGFLPGTDQEWNGIIRHGAKLLYAFTEATVPKLTVVTRKAYGGAYDVMNSKHMLADYNVAWPTAEVAVMGPEGAVNIIYRKDIASSPTPDERRQKLIDDYKAHFANPYSAAERGYIDDVIEPRQTRPKLIKALRMLQSKRVEQPKRKHGNIPLLGLSARGASPPPPRGGLPGRQRGRGHLLPGGALAEVLHDDEVEQPGEHLGRAGGVAVEQFRRQQGVDRADDEVGGDRRWSLAGGDLAAARCRGRGRGAPSTRAAGPAAARRRRGPRPAAPWRVAGWLAQNSSSSASAARRPSRQDGWRLAAPIRRR